MSNYTAIHHRDSANSERRGLLKKFNPLTGRVERVSRTTVTLIKDRGGKPLEHMHTAEVIRSFRSRYVPHVGKKQEKKAAMRELMKPKHELALYA